MATVYKFQVSMPVDDTLARNRISNVFCMQHVTGGLVNADLQDIAEDVVAMWQTRYHDLTKEVQCKVYDTDAKPNYPRADAVVNGGNPWLASSPREVALCLSFAGEHRGNKSERGRLYLMPDLDPTSLTYGLRPSGAHLQWALDFYTDPNASLPDLGGVDWKFGVWSKTYGTFKQTTQAWVNDDWDTMRSRGLRETTRLQATREG